MARILIPGWEQKQDATTVRVGLHAAGRGGQSLPVICTPAAGHGVQDYRQTSIFLVQAHTHRQEPGLGSESASESACPRKAATSGKVSRIQPVPKRNDCNQSQSLKVPLLGGRRILALLLPCTQVAAVRTKSPAAACAGAGPGTGTGTDSWYGLGAGHQVQSVHAEARGRMTDWVPDRGEGQIQGLFLPPRTQSTQVPTHVSKYRWSGQRAIDQNPPLAHVDT